MNLADLAPDIIKMILHMDEDSLDNVRWISPAWNCSVIEYLSEPRYKIPLKEVELRCRIKKNPEEDDEVCMLVKVPMRYLGRLGVNAWLKEYQIEDPVVSLSAGYQNVSVTEGGGITRGVYRFTRFFSHFSRIDTLVMESFDDWNVLKRIMKMIGNLNVEKLDIVSCNVQDDSFEGHIIDLINQHEIRHVSIEFDGFSVNSGRFISDDFILQLAKLNVTLCLFEREWDLYFNRTVDAWEERANKLDEQGISIRQEMNNNAALKALLIYAYLSIMTKDQRNGGLEQKLIMGREKRGL